MRQFFLSIRLRHVGIFGIFLVSCQLFYVIYFTSIWLKLSKRFLGPEEKIGLWVAPPKLNLAELEDIGVAPQECVPIFPAVTHVDTVQKYQSFDFKPSWINKRGFWDDNFEKRYKSQRKMWSNLPLKVILVPFTHNEPGSRMTFEEYYETNTRHILNSLVKKMTTLKNMTFVWSDISYLERWWQDANYTERMTLTKLAQEGRLEIVTGGWVTADEATTHIYALLDQLIEGHHWLKSKLNINPTSGWSIDPFGHGATFPYLLRASGVCGGTVIQRIHYAWKKWLAEEMKGDFLWRQNWDIDGINDLLVHNQPFFHYTTQYSCGPDSVKCSDFDFGILSRIDDGNISALYVVEENVKRVSEVFLEELGKTGSLYPHNVVLLPVGDDFRYRLEVEWDQVYINYMEIIKHIYQNRELYNAEVSFGTPRDYFKSIMERMNSYSTFKGDFFVYSDVFNEIPTYWSGYFITQSFWETLRHELESKLRSTEILYSFAQNILRQNHIKYMSVDVFLKLSNCRKTMSLLQHQDSITGDFREYVMKKRFSELSNAVLETLYVQRFSAKAVILAGIFQQYPNISQAILDSDKYLETYSKLRTYEVGWKTLKFSRGINKLKNIVIFNSLGQPREEIIKIYVSSPYVKVIDDKKRPVLHQINPLWNLTRRESEIRGLKKLVASKFKYELIFVARLPPLSLVSYELQLMNQSPSKCRSVIYCNSCKKISGFQSLPINKGDILVENNALRLLFYGNTGLLKSIHKKFKNETLGVKISFSNYDTSIFETGEYHLKRRTTDPSYEKWSSLLSILGHNIVVSTGPVMTEVKVVFKNLLEHSVRIYNIKGSLSQAIQIDNLVNIGYSRGTKHLMMRIKSDINNNDPPEFYTDSNGFQMQKRVAIRRIPVQGNVYPVTSMAYIQGSHERLSLLVNHAQGVTSHQTGWIDVVINRDNRLEHSLSDQKTFLSKYWLLFENPNEGIEYSMPTLLENYLSLGLLSPPDVFILDLQSLNDYTSQFPQLNFELKAGVTFLSKPLPCDIHLMSLKTISPQTTSDFGYKLPSNVALLLLHRQGFSCKHTIQTYVPKCGAVSAKGQVDPGTSFVGVKIKSIEKTSLTGLRTNENLTAFDSVTLNAMEIVTLKITFA